MKRKVENKPVAFVALADGKENAPFGDKSFEWWTCNGGCLYMKDVLLDVCFDMHDWPSCDYYPKFYEELQKKQSYKVVKPYADKTVPNCEVFPLKEAKSLFYQHPFGSTMSYIIAYAVIKGKRDLYIWGMNDVEFIEFPEYGESFGYCRGIAQNYGLRVHIISPTVPHKAHFYGYKVYSWKEAPEILASENYVIKALHEKD